MNAGERGEAPVNGGKGGRIPADPDVRALMTRLSLSMALIWLIQQLYSSVDMIIAGRALGAEATAAIATASDFTSVMTMVATGLAGGAAVYISQLAGAKDTENLRKAVGSTLLLLLLVAAVAVGYAVLFQKHYLEQLQCPPEALSGARAYLLITAAGIPFIFAYTGIVCILKGMGEAKSPLLYAVVSCGMNVAGDAILVLGLGMGIEGSAVATVLSQAACFLLAFRHLSGSAGLFGEIPLIRFIRFDRRTVRRILRMGLPQVVRILLVQFSFLWLRRQINGYGLIEASIYSIWYKLERLSNFVVFGVQEASGNVIGQMIGARRLDQVRPVVRLTLLLSAAGAVVPFLLFLLIPKPIYSLFTKNPDVIAGAPRVLWILGIGLFVNAFGNGSKGISVGAGAWLVSLMVGVLDAGARVAVSLLASGPLGLGADGFYWGMALAPLIPGAMCLAYLQSDRWRKRKVLSEI